MALKQFDKQLSEVLIKGHQVVHGRSKKLKLSLEFEVQTFKANGSHPELRYVDVLGVRIIAYNPMKNPDRKKDSMVYIRPIGNFVEGSFGRYFKAEKLATGMVIQKENGPSAFAFEDNVNGNGS